VAILRSVPERIHAWDTETIDLEVRTESPVGKGRILCAQCFAGPDLDFGNGPRLFIDNYADAEGIIESVFKEYLEDDSMKKVWHNYGFDRHIMANHGIDLKGFGGDTMHMARLADPSRLRYGLKYITQALESEIIQVKNAIIAEQVERLSDCDDKKSKERLETLQKYEANFLRIQKVDIQSTFGFYKRLATGEQGKILMMPNLELMHCSEQFVPAWVEYSAFDAEILYFLRETLALQLSRIQTPQELMGDLQILYQRYWLPFGELLTDMESVGFKVDTRHLRKA
jgi:DNA polymerase I